MAQSRFGILCVCLTFIVPVFSPGLGYAGDGGWLTLKESIALACRQSLVIQAAREGIKGAEAQKKEAFTDFLPKLSTSYSYVHLNDEPSIAFPALTFASPLGPLTVPGANYPIGTKDNYSWALEVRQLLFAGGAIHANYQATKTGVALARVQESTSIQDVVREVKVCYFNVLKAEKILDVAKKSVEQLEAHRAMAWNFYDVGLISKNDLLQSEVLLAGGLQNLVKADNGVELARASFNTLLRRNIDEAVTIEDILAYRPFGRTIDECLKTAMENRLEIKGYDLKVQQMGEHIKVAEGGYYPAVSAVGHYERFGDSASLAGSAYKSQETWAVSVRADWTFWEWGRTKNRADAYRAREGQLSSLRDNERDRVVLEVKAAFLKVREAEKQVFVAQKAIEQAEENLRINQERYREQVGTSTDVLDANTLLTKTRSDHVNALGDFYINQAHMERAMGEQ
jgi:outer membrane protein